MNMKQVVFIILFFAGVSGFAQNEFNTRIKPIPPANTGIVPKAELPPITDAPKPNIPAIETPNILEKQDLPKSNSNYRIGESNSISMIKTNDFVNPGDRVRDQLNKEVDQTLVRHGLKEDDSYIRRTDVDFGIFKTKSKKLLIRVRDYGAIDGDLIKATVINEYTEDVAANNLRLGEFFVDIRVDLKLGVSFVELQALNRGALGGNTGNFEIYDETGKLLVTNFWDNIDTGVKSRFTFIRE